MNSVRLFAAGVVLAAGLWGGHAWAWVSKEIRDWSVDCSNGLTCNMGFADWGAKGMQYVGFQRAGMPDAPVSLKFRAAPDFAPDSAPDASYRFMIDGKDVLTLRAADVRPDESGAAFVYSDQARVIALLDAMEAGAAMEVSVSTKNGSHVLAVKLSGVKGAMLYIDEVQDRLGRTDALEAKGEKVPPEDAIARDITGLDQLPALVRNDFTADGGACADLEVDTIGQFNGFDVKIEGTRLIAVPCGTGGAYNQPYALYLDYDVVTERVSFPDVRENLPSAMTTAYNLDFDAKSRILTSFFKGRGIGDCGLWYKWRLDTKGGGAALVLLEERSKDDCDENDMGGPQNFPLVFPAQK